MLFFFQLSPLLQNVPSSPPASPIPSTSTHSVRAQHGSGGSRTELGYNIEPTKSFDSERFGVKGTDYKITLQNANTRHYQQLVDEFKTVMNDIVDHTLGDADPDDYVRFVIKSDDLNRPLNTPFHLRSQVNGDWLSELAGKMLQSHETLDVDNLIIHVQHVEIPRGRGLRRKLAVNMLLNIILKRCVFTICKDHNDIPCFGYALVLATKLLTEERDSVRDFTHRKGEVLERVHACFLEAGVEYGPVDFKQYHNYLPSNSRLIIVDAKERGTSLLYKSDVIRPLHSPVQNVCLLLHDKHYYPLTSLTAWYGRSYYCVDCEIAVKDNTRHKCEKEKMCYLCKHNSCLKKSGDSTFCGQCFGNYRNSTCFENHITNDICSVAESCDNCGQWYSGSLANHECNTTYCCYCHKEQKIDHKCFIEVQKKIEIKSWKYIFYDFECTQNTIDPVTGRPVHEVNYCIAMSVCDNCKDNESCQDCLPVHTFSGLGGENALYEFCKWAFDDPLNQGAVFIAHNGSGYDVNFILSYLIEQTEYPTMIANGGKILEMYVKTCKAKFIDSCCFLSMPLSRFSDTFNLPNVVKGTFPHLFNTRHNYKYVGPLPDLHYYGPDGLKEPARTNLIDWHNDHANDEFNFSKEIHEYCKADVQLLKSGCMKFRSAFISDTGIDPFQSCTIAASCMKVLRTSHLKPNTIGRVPVNGYRNVRNYSNKSMAWITYCESITGVRYEHAWSGGEKHLKDAKVWADAYYETPRHRYVMAFMGCHFHGCPTCYDKATMNTHLNKSMGALYRETQRWINRVIFCNYKISVMWECEWDRLVNEDNAIKAHVERYSLSSPLNPREALYGGRCETFSLHAEMTQGSVIKYVDVQSLYPYVCKTKHYPIGHARCLIGPALSAMGKDLRNFEGLVKCKMLPPKGLRIPLLPSHINGKLMFVLCRTCAETANQVACAHTDNQRALTGTWVSVELHKALEIGYTVSKIYEVWQYDEITVYDSDTDEGGLFAQYMNTFMKLKMEASGYPSCCTTDDSKRRYIDRVREHEGISLDHSQIVYNAGRRAVAKLCLNNIWGKFAQNPDKSIKEFVTDPKKFFHLLCDDGYEVSDVHPINDDCLYVNYKKTNEFQIPATNTNVVIASYVTTHARLELYSYLERLSERALYCDTDSVIYKHVEGQYNPPLSEFVGGMTDELDGSYITEYLSNGPKNYAYRTADGKQVVKVKGFTLNYVSSRQLTFDAMKEMAISDRDERVLVIGAPQIKKDLKRRQINTLPFVKT